MLAFYRRIQFPRSAAVAVHDLDGNTVQVVETLNGNVTVDRTYEYGTAAEVGAYLADLDERLTAAGFTPGQLTVDGFTPRT